MEMGSDRPPYVQHQRMGIVASAVRRSARNWNVDHRAQRQLEKDRKKPRPAPRLLPVESADLNSSELGQESDRSLDLEARVNQMNIRDSMFPTTGVLPGDEKVKASSKMDNLRPLPRKMLYDYDAPANRLLGYMEPEVIPAGKLTLRQALDLIAAHKQSKASVEELSDKYKLSHKLVQQILTTFHPFSLKTESEFKAQLAERAASDVTSSTPVLDAR